ncbi:alpha-ketoacid dehydrogenase subunit beta [Aestuariimicrobium sp. p3-SID1156]|uniref:alpha-ketoacid dehydrogenase subunit beta n=1 Tax=Aestuariimicrobium sp. p3-SID1156 TaxID=2916038 RepID=UPI00223AA867|nr:alpha-ketoacid dehydrogenase subunit beta [Aestuariimicrobium sp. p3-SID1156]MCT1458155.1 alpha-ketoacid dehydrogenase subunit beta [Aestuariimicrobium sp. p3-SID1156]
MSTLTLGRALNAGLRRALEADPKVLLAGQDIGALGGVFRITEGLQRDFGEDRVIDSPLAESGIIGTAIGLAMRGYRPVCEIQFEGFVFPGFDQIVTQLAKFHFRSNGAIRLPVVVRIPYGGGIGAIEHHSESPESYFVHTPGLKVVTCSHPADAYWMIQQAIASDDPVIFFEPKRRYHEKGEVDEAASPMPLHQARVARLGRDITLLAWGPQVKTCLEVASIAEEEGRSVEVVDLRSLSPIDMVTITDSVKRTKRAIVVHEAHRTLGVGAELAARLGEELFYTMEAPVLRVTGYDTPYPWSRVEEDWLPNADRILDAIDESMGY